MSSYLRMSVKNQCLKIKRDYHPNKSTPTVKPLTNSKGPSFKALVFRFERHFLPRLTIEIKFTLLSLKGLFNSDSHSSLSPI
jgi:hypothetical protein